MIADDTVYRNPHLKECHVCKTMVNCVSFKVRHFGPRSSIFPWRDPPPGQLMGKPMCQICSGREAFWMLSQAEKRILELEEELGLRKRKSFWKRLFKG